MLLTDLVLSGALPAASFNPPASPAISAGAVTRWSGPAAFCNCPRAIIIARRALPRAIVIAEPCDEVRNEMVDRDNKPTANKVRRIIRLSVMTNAKPRGCLCNRILGRCFMG